MATGREKAVPDGWWVALPVEGHHHYAIQA
ncbi:hypothetical protein FHX82_003755 [Amycolatopsis bartoniae]|nr:hypothetical protein [Amycolatopsis bartoniae]